MKERKEIDYNAAEGLSPPRIAHLAYSPINLNLFTLVGSALTMMLMNDLLGSAHWLYGGPRSERAQASSGIPSASQFFT